MRNLLFITLLIAAVAPGAGAQSLDRLNLQVHGFVSQGLLYTSDDNIFTTHSNRVSPAWTEAVLSVSSQPLPRLRVAVQARYFFLGRYGNGLKLDYAQADWKLDDRFGIRFGKVKTPSGLYNERQDAPACYLWALLPQPVYQIGSRDSLLAHYGAVGYGTLEGGAAGKLEYRGWVGERVVQGSDGVFVGFREAGISLPDGIRSRLVGGALHWLTPVPGLMLGMSENWNGHAETAVHVPALQLAGEQTITRYHNPSYFARWARGRAMVAAEYSRLPFDVRFTFPGTEPITGWVDARPWYVMTGYRVSRKVTLGAYRTQMIDHGRTPGPARYSKDWDATARYDFNSYLYAKAEQHWIRGTRLNYDTDLNPNGLKPSNRLTVLKVGVSF